jgi:L-alanine-DL-glutamate epimerase-like enolase superfamily enzyme
VALGIPVHIQCAGGSSITQAAIVHLAQSTPADRLLYIWDIGDLVSLETVQNPVLPVNGTMCAHNVPGLGVEPKEQILSESVMVFE